MATRILMVLLLISAAPALAGKPKFPPSTGQSALYACADGRTIEVLYSGGDAVVLTIAGDTVQLARTASADGERYAGSGWQWWSVGQRSGALSRSATGDGAPGRGIDCRAR